jgi:hypothetical protein
MYLPLDQLMKKTTEGVPPINVTIEEPPVAVPQSSKQNAEDARARSRERR